MPIRQLLFSTFIAYFSWTALAEERFPDLPRTGLILLEPSDHKTFFTSFRENGYLVLRSNLSQQWQKGVFFNPQNGRVTIPGLGAANLIKTDEGYTWNTQTQEATFEKKGSMIFARRKQGCELSWSFFVQSRGKALVNENGRLGYACSTGSYSSPVPIALGK
jgi:hypothetical protein